MEKAVVLDLTGNEAELPPIGKFRNWIEGASNEYVPVVDAESDPDLIEIRGERELFENSYVVSHEGQFSKAVFTVKDSSGADIGRVVAFFQPDFYGCISMDIYRKRDDVWSRRPGNHDFDASGAQKTVQNALKFD